MGFYRYRDVSSAQVQATGVWVQAGATLMGWCRSDYRKRGVTRPLWFGLTLWAPISGCGQREAFGLRIGRARMTYTTRGETVPGHYRWADSGLHFDVRCRRAG